MKHSRWAATLVAAGIVAAGLSGCSSSSGGGSSDSLTVQDYYAEPQAGQMKAIYDSCASQLGVKINIVHVASNGLIAKVLQQVSSKTMPDVLMLDNPNVQQIAASGALAPLSQFGITGDGFAKGAVSAGSYNGKLYAVPPVLNSISLFYNKDILSQAGITPPKTWDELAADAKQLTKPGRYGFAFSAANTGEGTWTFLPFMWSNGGDETNIATPQTAQALQYLTGLVSSGSASKSVVNWTQADVNDQFIAGKAAMMINGPWQIPALDKAGVHWASVSIPTREAGQTVVSPLGGETFSVPNTGHSASMKKAAQFVSCLTNDQNEATKAANEDAVPSRTDAAAKFASSNPELASFVSIVADGRSRTAQLGAKWPATETAIYTAVQAAITGEASPQAALQQAQSQISK
ncbi:extracellular solute-binding protein family 1 [Catenulispora acidiphila DSM 44928]|uniref:Extracellular solute-binding protein family 1 n=1 Tax=Catenulispora acidiphila (strain DSM 44928 / JCM 14897 / NBRC 102108 / NRRL B-24433 / ID139908) TaxID=479433 RepID=C7Q3H6_CATAD|nr:extracellular solute-binding protein family 1 [Catenulispora acidiphila DSM 44928]